MSTIELTALDAELDRLAAMLPDWRLHMREPRHFAPQFIALADALLAQARPCDLAHARDRLAAMLEGDERAEVARERARGH